MVRVCKGFVSEVPLFTWDMGVAMLQWATGKPSHNHAVLVGKGQPGLAPSSTRTWQANRAAAKELAAHSPPAPSSVLFRAGSGSSARRRLMPLQLVYN